MRNEYVDKFAYLSYRLVSRKFCGRFRDNNIFIINDDMYTISSLLSFKKLFISRMRYEYVDKFAYLNYRLISRKFCGRFRNSNINLIMCSIRL